MTWSPTERSAGSRWRVLDQMRNEIVASVDRSFSRPKTLPVRTFHEVISPSTHTEPQVSMKPRIVSLSRATEVGASEVDSRGRTESGGGVPMGTAQDQSRTVDSMIFTVRGDEGETHPLNRGKGFLIDNLAYASSTADECPNRHADGDGDVQSASGGRSHGHFHKDGCGKSDNDSVKHDDSERGHSFQSTSVDAATYSTAADGRTVTMTGTGLDNGLPVAFTLIAVDYDGLIPATYSLVLSDGYTFVGGLVTGGVSV